MPKFFRIILFSLGFLLIWTLIFPNNKNRPTEDVIIETSDSITIGSDFMVTVRNRSQKELVIPAACPNTPLTVERYFNGEWTRVEAPVTPCADEEVRIQPDKAHKFSLDPWKPLLFNEPGKYRLSLEQTVDEKTKIYSKEVELTPPGIFRQFFRNVFYKPIFNFLIFLISIIPNHNLGWATIVLTLIIKLILLVPNQKALKAQKKMQKIQPELDALKIRHKEDPKKLAEETMHIWKKHQVSPTSSCLPMLIQFPILIALFYVVKSGFTTIDPAMLYPFLKGFDASTIGTHFLGLDLTKLNLIVLPVIIGLLQFAQMYLTIGKNLNMQSPDTPLPMMNKTMLYVMPIMIAFFTATLPAIVGFYWGTSTLFGIAQQMVVNKSKD